MKRRDFLGGSIVCCASQALAASDASQVDLLALRAAAAKRREHFFSSQAGKPFVPGKIDKNWQNRGDFTRHYVQSVVLFAARALRLNEQLEVANKALADMCQYHLDRPQTMLEIHSLPWSLAPLAQLVMLFGPQGNLANGRIANNTYAVLSRMLWEWASVRSKISDTEVSQSQTWTIQDSENHHANHFSACFAISKVLSADPAYRDRKFQDGHSSAEHFSSWTTYLREYTRQRACKGTAIEIDSPSYSSATLGAYYFIHEFTDDPVLKRRAGDLITLVWALWAEQQINGINGGAKTRCYPASAERGGSLLLRAVWYVLGIGSGKESDPAGAAIVLPFVSCTREIPDVVLDVAADVRGRGTYEVQGRRMGLAAPGNQQALLYRMRTDTGGIVRYSYCTPDFVMGSLLLEARPADHWAAISSQNRWQGVIFRGADDARIYPYCETDPSSRNAQWSVQRKGTLIVQKLKTSQEAGALRVWFSKEGLSTPVKTAAWYFSEAEGAWAAVRVVSGETQFAEDAAKTRGRILNCSDEYAPVILEVARRSDFANLDAFRTAVLALPVQSTPQTLHYTGLSGDRFTFPIDQKRAQKRAPEINAKTIDYAPPKVYDSPFVQSKWNSGVVTIQKGARKSVLDFNR